MTAAAGDSQLPGRAAQPVHAQAGSPGLPNRWPLLGLVAFSYFLLYAHRSLIGFVKKPVSLDLSLDSDEFGSLGTAFLFSYAVAQIGAGFLGDRFTRRTVLVWSLLASSVVLVLTSLADGYASLLVLRIALGIAQSASVPAIASTMADAFTPKTRSRAVGFYLISYNLALVLTGKYGGRLADTEEWRIPQGFLGQGDLILAGWRMSFLAFAALGIFVTLVFALLFREPPRMERLPDRGLGTGRVTLSTALSTVLGVPTYLMIAAMFILTSALFNALQFWLPTLLQERFDVSLEKAGFLATVWIQSATVAGLFVGGWLGDFGARHRVAGRSLVQLIGMAAIGPAVLVIGQAGSMPFLVAAMIVYGFGVGLYQANLWTTTFEVVDPAARSTAIGLLNVGAGVIGSWSSTAVGLHDQVGLDLGSAVAVLGGLAAVACLVSIGNMLWCLPRDYRGPLHSWTRRSSP
jgi:sugar phosphate permease